MPPSIRRLGVVTGGGDAPGLNAAIRAVVKSAATSGIECIGVEDSFHGLIHPERTRPLGHRDVSGILRLGGTILGTTDQGNPFDYPDQVGTRTHNFGERVVETFQKLGLDALVVIGGDGTLAIAHEFQQRGVPVVGIPKTIDNDVAETTMTVGFDTAAGFAAHAVDRLHATAEAHHRIMVVEVMGRHAGWIALHAGLAGGADVILIPEIPFQIDRVATRVQERERFGARFSIVVVAEGAYPVGGRRSMLASATAGHRERLGGIASRVSNELERLTRRESRWVVLGHLQRGGSPSAYDRTLATRFGSFAVELARQGRFGVMTALASADIEAVPLERIVGRTRSIPPDDTVLRTARQVGISLGD